MPLLISLNQCILIDLISLSFIVSFKRFNSVFLSHVVGAVGIFDKTDAQTDFLIPPSPLF